MRQFGCLPRSIFHGSRVGGRNEQCSATIVFPAKYLPSRLGSQNLATTLGETGGDAVTMSWLHADQNAHNGRYLIGTAIFLAIFVAAIIAQISTTKFNPWVYWLAIVASTTVGTAMADFSDRSLGIGYVGGSSILLACVLCSLVAWYFTLGTVDVDSVTSPKAELFYWITITFSQTLGTV